MPPGTVAIEASEVLKPDYSALDQPLAPEYGNAAIKNLQNQFNFMEERPRMDFIRKGYTELIKPVNIDYKNLTQTDVLCTIPGNNQEFIADIHMCLDVQPVLTGTHTALTGTVRPTETVGNAVGVAGNTNALQCIQRPLTPYLMFRKITLELNNTRVDFDEDACVAFKQFLLIFFYMNMEDEDRLRVSHDFDFPPATEDMDAGVANDINTDADHGTAWQKRRRVLMKKRQNYIVPLSIPILKATALVPVGANVTVRLSKADQRVLFHKDPGLGGNANNGESWKPC